MQLFIPSLIVIILAAILAFLVIPRTGPMILAVVSLVALIAVGVHHYSLFYSEYQLSTWQNGLAANASFIVLGIALLFIVGAILFMFTGDTSAIRNAMTAPMETLEESIMNSSALPPASTATNSVTSALNQGITSMMGNSNQTNRKNTNTNTGAMAAITKPFEAMGETISNIKNSASKAIPGLGFKASEI